ncbi:MAG: cysteine--tRNA ligase [Spirochaetes bacterium]|nr:cysteine--tRNA ligase [Spirochaetota bacterium]
MSTLKIYNTLTKTMEEFIPGGVKKNRIEDYPEVSIYSCGPTVYNFAHIGNFRTFTFNDMLRRYLKFRGYKVNHTLNLTDVDDKTINGAKAENKSLKEYTDRFIEFFKEDLKTLNFDEFEHYPRATESIPEMADIIDRLEKNGFTYEKDNSIYFSIAKWDHYGQLSELDKREIQTGTRYDTDEYEKDDIRDFVLWKAPKSEDEPQWEINQGSGRPGWHIECSAMIRKIYGTTIDIHTGGVDLIFPHHENEIAQSEAAYGEKFVRYWMHVKHLFVEGAKMSKSKGTFYTIRDLVEKGYSPRSIRYLLFSAHYRKQLNFTLAGLDSIKQPLARIDNFVARLKLTAEGCSSDDEIVSASGKFISSFIETMDDDLNISGALGNLFDYIHEINSIIDQTGITENGSRLVYDTLKKADSVFGFIFFNDSKDTNTDIDAERIEKMIAERKEAKAAKNFAAADSIRDALLSEGIILEDGKDGTTWKRK